MRKAKAHAPARFAADPSMHAGLAAPAKVNPAVTGEETLDGQYK
jgi:hypothetical protein